MWKNNPSKHQRAGSKPPTFTLVSRLAYSSTLKMGATFSSKTSVDFNGLHGVVSQNG
jgi:hypothetical protein